MKNEIIYRSDQYYQGILQLRPRARPLLEFVLKEIKRHPQGELSKLVETKAGYDLYLTSNIFLIALGAKIRRRFPGILKKSRQLYGRHKMTSREIYRVTICFRLKPSEQ